MNRLILTALAACFLLFVCSGCSKDSADTEAADRLRDTLLAAESGETTGDINIDTHFFTTELETYGYRLITRDVALPENETALREAISLVNWWCNPSAMYCEDVVPAFEYVGVKLINNEVECYNFSTGYFEDGEFVWCGAFAVDFNATQIYELNNQTLEYKLIYQEK